LDALSGKSLWEGATNNAVMGGPSVYSINGIEYVAVMAGIGGTFSLDPRLNKYGYRYGTGRRLLAFRLGGTATLPAMALVAPEPAPAPASSDPHILHGAALYSAHCSNCHGYRGTNAGGAPDLRRSAWINTLSTVLIDGALVPNGMPSFKRYLSNADVEDLQAYLKDRALPAF
jgi:quinohemoprotein ethanol dehydrogenase